MSVVMEMGPINAKLILCVAVIRQTGKWIVLLRDYTSFNVCLSWPLCEML